MYQCSNCKNLQDGVKTVEILEGPKHLICSINRFKYERALNSKQKVFTKVNYEREIHIPIAKAQHVELGYKQETKPRFKQNLINACDQEDMDVISEYSHKNTERYYLYAVVVHSGDS